MGLVLAFMMLLGGAGALYQRLGDTVETEQLAVTAQEPQKAEAAPQEENAEGEKERLKAPDFLVYDESGKEVRLTDYVGKPIVLNFWASWCGPCQMEMPDFHEQYKKLGDEVHFLMVNMTDGSRETVERASSFVKENGYTFPVFYDTEASAAMTYGVYSLPTTYFIDADGYGVAQASGAINAQTLLRGIDMITGS